MPNKNSDNSKNTRSVAPKTVLEEALSVGLYLIAAHDKFSMHLWAKKAFFMKNVAEIEYKLNLMEDARSHATIANKILSIAKGKNSCDYMLALSQNTCPKSP